jgi:N6-adenosine-specific RNA methylase IME4
MESGGGFLSGPRGAAAEATATVPLRAANGTGDALSSLASEINRECDLAERAWSSALEHALRAGELLNEAKARVRHGTWTAWLRKNFERSPRLAQSYMQLARQPDAQRSADLSIDAALKQITRKSRNGHVPPVETPPLPAGRFSVLLADPPWRYEAGSVPDSSAIENHYPTMELEAIKGLTVPAADNAVLFLWAPAPKLAEALEVMAAWDFTYRTHAVWDKGSPAMGCWWRQQHEDLLTGTRGAMRPPPRGDRCPSVLYAKRGHHSEKPSQMYEWIERMYPGHPKLELFARRQRPGWIAWGNEVLKEPISTRDEASL